MKRLTAKHWAIGLGTAAVVLGAAVLGFKHWSGSSSTGTLHVGKPAEQTAPKKAPTPLAIDTPYFSTVVPGGFEVRRRVETPAGPTLLQLSATTDRLQFAVTVGTLPSEGLVGVGNYNLRITDTATYTEYRPAGLPAESIAFRTTSGPAAFVVFWPHGTRYAEIALSSDGGSTLGQLFVPFVQAAHDWQWK